MRSFQEACHCSQYGRRRASHDTDRIAHLRVNKGTGSGGGIRTHTARRPGVFKTPSCTNSDTPPLFVLLLLVRPFGVVQIKHHAVEDILLADERRIHPCQGQHRLQHDRTADDDACALGLKPRECTPLGQRHD